MSRTRTCASRHRPTRRSRRPPRSPPPVRACWSCPSTGTCNTHERHTRVITETHLSHSVRHAHGHMDKDMSDTHATFKTRSSHMRHLGRVHGEGGQSSGRPAQPPGTPRLPAGCLDPSSLQPHMRDTYVTNERRMCHALETRMIHMGAVAAHSTRACARETRMSHMGGP